MAAVPIWLVGQHITAYVITGQTVAADGTLADAATTGVQALAGLWDEIDLESNPSTEEISAADSSRMHTVLIQEGTRIRMSVIMAKALGPGAAANAKANPLAWIATNFPYFKVVFTRAGQTWTGYFTRGQYSEQLRKGRSVHMLSGEPCDPGAVNPAYAAV